jgi:hypothetical protein
MVLLSYSEKISGWNDSIPFLNSNKISCDLKKAGQFMVARSNESPFSFFKRA